MKNLFYACFILAGVLFASCAEDGKDGKIGKDGKDGKDGTNGKSYLTNITNEPKGTNCAKGGLKVEVGEDKNANRKLDKDEVLSTSYICNGKSSDKVLVKVTDEPKGSNCPLGGSKVEVGIDQNGNGTLETDEVTSTTYVCNNATQGTTYLVISGDMTDQQVADKISKEVGSGTQFVWIQNTSALTTIDLSKVTQLIDLRVTNNKALTTVKLPNLKVLESGFTIQNNTVLKSINFPKLSIAGSISIYKSNITSLKLDNLTTLYGTLNASDNVSLTSLNLPKLTNAGGIYLNHSSITSISLNSLTTMTGNLNLYSTPLLTTLNLPRLTKVRSITMSSSKLTSLKLDNLTTMTGSLNFNNTPFTSINLPKLQSIQSDNSSPLRISNNTKLTSVSFPLLKKIQSAKYLNIIFDKNKLPGSQVNKALAMLVGINPKLKGYRIRLKQKPSARPFGQGRRDIDTLLKQGNRVDTD